MCSSVSGTTMFISASCFFFFSSRRRHTRLQGDWSSDVCSSDLMLNVELVRADGNFLGQLRFVSQPAGPELAVQGDVELVDLRMRSALASPVQAAGEAAGQGAPPTAGGGGGMGRAAGRGRVEISGGAVSIKKKKR